MSYTHQAKATRAFGIEFRSKLEAQWAYELERLYPGEWSYADQSAIDFTVSTPEGCIPIEVKPKGDSFMEQAILRAEKLLRSEYFVLLCGEPKEYLCFMCTDNGFTWEIYDWIKGASLALIVSIIQKRLRSRNCVTRDDDFPDFEAVVSLCKTKVEWRELIDRRAREVEYVPGSPFNPTSISRRQLLRGER